MKESYLAADFRETVAQRFPMQAEQLCGGFCRHGTADGQDHLAHRHDAVPLSRHLRAVWLSGAVPLFLRLR